MFLQGALYLLLTVLVMGIMLPVVLLGPSDAWHVQKRILWLLAWPLRLLAYPIACLMGYSISLYPFPESQSEKDEDPPEKTLLERFVFASECANNAARSFHARSFHQRASRDGDDNAAQAQEAISRLAESSRILRMAETSARSRAKVSRALASLQRAQELAAGIQNNPQATKKLAQAACAAAEKASRLVQLLDKEEVAP